MPFYAVRVGRRTGIFKTWSECEAQVKGFSGAKYKKFTSESDALAFCQMVKSTVASSSRSHNIAGIEFEKVQQRFNNIVSQSAPSATVKRLRDQSPDGIINSTEIDLQQNNNNNKHQKLAVDETRRVKQQEQIVIVYVDGSSLNNGNIGSRAGAGIYYGPGDTRNISRYLGTNVTNQMAELMAVKLCLQNAPSDTNLLIKTDSQYTIKGVTEWMLKWKANGFKTKVKNLDLFKDIDQLINGRTGSVKFEYVPGHQGFEGNEMADRLARNAALNNC
ncbi:hypothetical protein MIR68_011319 [Amoeboaphelidium protococcarum]|nr:hypothetical protein MIR68_011319 [Amoeboaphelidium protococcarum]